MEKPYRPPESIGATRRSINRSLSAGRLGGSGAGAGNVSDFLNQLQTTRVVSCTEAAWRFLGLSLAGWNVLISLALAAFAAKAASGKGFFLGR